MSRLASAPRWFKLNGLRYEVAGRIEPADTAAAADLLPVRAELSITCSKASRAVQQLPICHRHPASPGRAETSPHTSFVGKRQGRARTEKADSAWHRGPLARFHVLLNESVRNLLALQIGILHPSRCRQHLSLGLSRFKIRTPGASRDRDGFLTGGESKLENVACGNSNSNSRRPVPQPAPAPAPAVAQHNVGDACVLRLDDSKRTRWRRYRKKRVERRTPNGHHESATGNAQTLSINPKPKGAAVSPIGLRLGYRIASEKMERHRSCLTPSRTNQLFAWMSFSSSLYLLPQEILPDSRVEKHEDGSRRANNRLVVLLRSGFPLSNRKFFPRLCLVGGSPPPAQIK
ncbi:hypothetical protein G7Y89_g2246 [Cudoniella acicularis]|uniref:Uncharacterized protein n=1 Tax=Cudoniella acicularis TaxID=354080 RepID=A0A8H4W693_9HELO|nr:hypothetical protein G7Y89_g2246 [Cudoniella acicularis]